jgi:nucleoside-diphosphate-sugar epimerase
MELTASFECEHYSKQTKKMENDNHALVFGASGISGWALVKEALAYPTPTTFSQVTALSNRPLALEDCQWPDDPRLHLVSGIDLTAPMSSVSSTLREKVKNIEAVTHVFLTVYVDPGKDHRALVEANTTIIRTAVEAAQQVCPRIKSFILQTGGKAYGLGKFVACLQLTMLILSRAPGSRSNCHTPEGVLPTGSQAAGR